MAYQLLRPRHISDTVQNPTADFSEFDRETLKQLAHLDAKAYLKAHPGKKLTQTKLGTSEKAELSRYPA